jgi:D-lyxose ketol-isomerase
MKSFTTATCLVTALAVTLLNTGCSHLDPGSKSRSAAPVFDNASFYKDGKFDVEKGKDAVIALMKYHGYPDYPGMREALWVSDYGTGEFTRLGLAARMWKNNEADRYMLMDLFLLPGQMLPEHWHLAAGDNPSKREGWLVRYGSAHIVGEGEPNLAPEVVVPKCHNGGEATVKHEVFAKAGEFVALNREGAHHWQLAGPEGAIVTEVANVHTGPGVRHLDPAINKNFLGN